MIYDHIGGNNYRVILKIYRDCSSLTAFDGIIGPSGNFAPAVLTVMDVNGLLTGTYNIGAPLVTRIPPTINNPCIATPGNICVEEGIYTYTISLAPKAGGYYIVYQRCCRNNSIVNLLQSGNQGSTYFTKIPGPEDALVNNSPRFKKFPPIFLCNDLAFTFDHAAIDPDGDRLVFSLCPPFQGGSDCCPVIAASTGPPPCNPGVQCPSSSPPPPYAIVDFISPYNGSYPIASNPSVTIDPNTGMLSGKPTLIGQYVVGVCVQEFRNNVLIGTHFRDFQFNIVACVVSVVSQIAEAKEQCLGNTITFTNTSVSNVGSLTYLWDFGVNNVLSDTSNILNPTYTYQDTGVYVLTLIANPRKPCADTLKKSIYIYPPFNIDFLPQKQCFRNNNFSFNNVGISLPQATYTWNFGAAATPSTSVLKNPGGISYMQPGIYTVQLLGKQFACRDTSYDTVRVVKRPEAKIKDMPLTFCNPAKILFSDASSSDLPLKYLWTFSNGSHSEDKETTQVFSPTGIYSAMLTVITTSLCVDSSMASVNNITVNPSPLAAFNFSPEVTSIFDPEITITDKASADVLKWNYSFGDGSSSSFPNEIHTYRDYGDFTIVQTVSNQFSCSNVTGQIVRILPEFRFWIPDSFTPDGNNLNDLFGPSIIGIIDYEFFIYDRWGNRIFRTNDTRTGWDGTYKGELCKDDIYAWKIIFKNAATLDDEVRTGHVLLMKNL